MVIVPLPTGDPNKVVKITKSARDGQRAREQMERNLWCLAHVYEVTKLDNAYKIVAEKLLPLTGDEIAEIERAMSVWNQTWKFPKDSPITIGFGNLWRALEIYGLDTGDVKPRNLGKRAETGELVLLDFG